MIYYGLPEFSQLVANGGINISSPIALKSMDHNMIHNISFLDHCNYLCQKHETSLLRLLSVLLQKLNGDMILRVNKYPQLHNKLQGEISEWSESIEPLDLFRCPNGCYNSENVMRLKNDFQMNEEEFKRINSDLKEDTSNNLYEVLETLKNNYHSCDEDLRNNLLEIEERRNEYNPPYREILSNLSTKPKAFYMSDLLRGNDNINDNVNIRLVKGIPENIHVVFLNSILLPTLITKCMEGHKSECMALKESITSKHTDIEQIMSRIEPGIPLTDSILNFISGVKGFFDENNEGLMSDDSSDDEREEDKIANVLNRVVNKEDNQLVVKEDKQSDVNDGGVYHLKIINSDDEDDEDDTKDKDDDEDDTKDKDDDEDDDDKDKRNQSDVISFFD
jgi:hypothetical protein